MMRDLIIIDINYNPCYASATNTPFHHNLPLLGHTDLRLADGDLLGLRVHAHLLQQFVEFSQLEGEGCM